MAKIGIDFGTTNSLIVAYNKISNTFKYFTFDDGGVATPVSSTVWYHDNKIEVGSEARKNINRYASVDGHHFEKSIKLKIGQKNGINRFGRIVEPYLIAADILNKIKNLAEEQERVNPFGADLNRAIFTIPINFDGNQRKALRKAANTAGFEVETFIHEPFAAIIGYFFTKHETLSTEGVISKLSDLEGKYLLIFDWGGGTLDITVVKVTEGKMIEKGTAELTAKAGDKFDELIAFWAWNKFKGKYHSEFDEAFLEQKRKDNWDRILAIAEECKIGLTDQNTIPFIVRNIIEGYHIREKITRSDIEYLIKNIMQEASNEIDNAIREAGITDENIDQVLLTGGTCNIPAVQAKLKDKFGYRVNTVKNADLLIAQGAAVISEMNWTAFLAKNISIELSDNSFFEIFKKGTPVSSVDEGYESLDLVCTDHRGGIAKVIIVEEEEKQKDRNLATLKVPVLNYSNLNNFKDYPKARNEINLVATLDRDIVLKINAHSLLVHGEKESQEFSKLEESEVNQLCFGLKFENSN